MLWLRRSENQWRVVKTGSEFVCASLWQAPERAVLVFGVCWRKASRRVGKNACGWDPQVSEREKGVAPSWLGYNMAWLVE